jgi:hypothetical protein
MSKHLTDADVERAAALLGVTPAHIRTVAAVESAGEGFADDGRPIVRFEPHWFQRLTAGRHDKTHPHLSHAYSRRRAFRQPANQAERWSLQLDPAFALDRDAAIQATSWGMFQMMGFNHRRCGFLTPQAFLNAHWRSEGGQLDAAAAFIKSAGLADELQRGDWAGFAHGYNGSDSQ